MNNYRNQIAPRNQLVPFTNDFAGKMRTQLNARIQNGRDGLDLNSEKKGHSPWMIYRNHDMSQEVFELGCTLQETMPELNYKAWVAWMTDADIHHTTNGIVIHHRSEFFAQQANIIFGDILRTHFGVTVKFIADHNIRMRVEP